MIQGPPNPEIIAPVVVSVVFFVSTAAVLIFRPLTKRIGDRIAASKQAPPPPPRTDSLELVELKQALEDTSARLERLEQRLDFTERLLSGPRTSAVRPAEPALPPPAPGA